MIKKSQLIASFNGITDIILIMDTDYNIVFVNDAFCEFYNIESSKDLIGRKCYRTCYNKSKPCSDCPAKETLESGRVTTIEKELNGEILKYWTYPVYDVNNTIKNIVSCSRIITDQKRMEWELIRSKKLKWTGQLAAWTAHEINSPLCSILGFSELMKESISETDPSCELLSEIIKSALQGKKIVHWLLEYSRQSVNCGTYYNISAVLKKAVDFIKYQQRLKEVSINLKIEKGLPKVKIDMQKTVQAVLNIILNGIEASTKGGKILISAQRYGEGYISVTFSDDGNGIPQENISHIFDPFFTTKEFAKGTGLGLSIAQSIIEQQNGEIKVKSESGKGSTFEVLFPVEGRNVDV